MAGLTVSIVAALYASLLFVLANWAKGRGAANSTNPFSPMVRYWAYSLAWAVFCTSWTFFGAVGTAVAEGWTYLPIYLGPILLFLFGGSFIERLIEAVKAEGATSISHFIGSRFSNSRGVAALITLLSLIGIIPYLALQLRSVGSSFVRLAGEGNSAGAMALTAITLAIFAMLFGTRTYEASSRNDGVLFAISLESIVKLVAFVAVGLFCAIAFMGAPIEAQSQGLRKMGEIFSPEKLSLDFFVFGFLAATAVICLPRQFYIGVIQATSSRDVQNARWPFITYLILTTLIVLPIALASFTVLPGTHRADLLVIDLPLNGGQTLLALFVFLGGFSAATGMVIVETIALSTMVSNDLIAPIILKNARWSKNANYGQAMLWIRRTVILTLMAVAYFYAISIKADARLAQIGLIAFAAVAQVLPTLILSVLNPNRDAMAAKAGLSAGLLVWSYTLFFPNILDPSLIAPLKGTLIDPHALLGIGGLSTITHGTLWSLAANMAFHSLFAARKLPRQGLNLSGGQKLSVQKVTTIRELLDLTASFVGKDQAMNIVSKSSNDAQTLAQPIDRLTARNAERLIASVIGAPSARAIMASAMSGASITIGDIALMLDHSGQSLQFSKDLLASTLEHIDPGVSVVDRHLNLVAWNSRYLDLFNYPPGLVRVGAPVSELIRYNALRGECGPGEVENHVERRLNHMRRRNRHSFERVREDGRVFKTVGGPMPGGGYVMCFTDITNEARTRIALEKARNELEIRVGQRTAELSRANRALAQATADKTRFLAAASHDLLQPLHAAKLFVAALDRQIDEKQKTLLQRIDQSIEAGEKLLRRLLDISKLDAGGVVPVPRELNLREKIYEVFAIFQPIAAEKNLKLRFAGQNALVNCDPTLLRSIVQNLLSNALRYTKKGGILVGIRNRGPDVLIEVYDTGVGIPLEKQKQIFQEFERLGNSDEAGIGLGLSIVERTARLIDAHIDLKSIEGRGSRFSVRLKKIRAIRNQIETAPKPEEKRLLNTEVAEKAVHIKKALIVDDDPIVSEAMNTLVSQSGYKVTSLRNYRAAVDIDELYDAYLLDYDLADEKTGLDLAKSIISRHKSAKIAIITAHKREDLIVPEGFDLPKIMHKPTDIDELTTWLAS